MHDVVCPRDPQTALNNQEFTLHGAKDANQLLFQRNVMENSYKKFILVRQYRPIRVYFRIDR